MPDQTSPGAPSGGPDRRLRARPRDDRHTAAQAGVRSITWYTTEPAQARPSGAGAYRMSPRRRLDRIVAVVALALALLLGGAGVARHIADAGAVTSPAPPAAPDVTLPQPLDPGTAAPASPEAGDVPAVDVAAVAARLSPAIVNITVENGFTASGGAATGIVLTADGYVLTNNHVIDGATRIDATLVQTGETYSADVAGYDATHDVALIKLRDASGLATAAVGDSSALAVGDVVVGAGNAGGDGGAPTVVAGVVLALDQQIVASDLTGDAQLLRGLIHTDADVRSGHSGGPLANADGEVIGVMTAASMGNPYHGQDASDTEGFAVPIATAMAIVEQIRDGDASGTVHVGETAFLGVQIADAGQSATGSGAGAAVTAVVPGSPAEAAGLAAGDVITAVDGAAVTSAEQLSSLIASYRPGDRVVVSWVDASTGTARSAQVELIKGPAR